MKASKSSAEREIISIVSDIEKCESMTESEMQIYFNTDDSKDEFMKVLKDELSFYEKELGECESECEESENVDCGFADMEDFLQYKFN